jgi:hypothetical protein
MPLQLKINEAGFILVESLVAITIVVVGLLGIFALLSRSLSLNRVVADRYTAAYLAAEGIEIVKNLVDNNLIKDRPWNTGLAAGRYEADHDDLLLAAVEGRSLNLDEQSGRYSYAAGQLTRFYRLINLELLGGGEELKVYSTVRWTGRGGANFQVDLEDHFLNWR